MIEYFNVNDDGIATAGPFSSEGTTAPEGSVAFNSHVTYPPVIGDTWDGSEWLPRFPSVEEMRSIRNGALQASDWTQAGDSPLTPEEVSAWAVYRQALRDFMGTYEGNTRLPHPPNWRGEAFIGQ